MVSPCSACGDELPNVDMHFCPYCGVPVETSSRDQRWLYRSTSLDSDVIGMVSPGDAFNCHSTLWGADCLQFDKITTAEGVTGYLLAKKQTAVASAGPVAVAALDHATGQAEIATYSESAVPYAKQLVVKQYTIGEAEYEINRWIRAGWTIESATGQNGHLHVGRTVIPALLTGGLSLLFGASRSSDKVTVIYAGTTALSRPDAIVLTKVHLFVFACLGLLAFSWMLNALHVPQPVVLVLGGAIAAAVMKTLFPNSKDAPLQEPVCEGESVEETIDCLASKGVTL